MYLVGGGTHPGSGLPVIFESAPDQRSVVAGRFRDVERVRPMARQVLVLLGFLLATFAVAAISGASTSGAVRSSLLLTIAQPAWIPPSSVFGPVWTILYATMAVAAWLVWRRAGWGGALAFFGVQLAFNAAWSPLFLGLPD